MPLGAHASNSNSSGTTLTTAGITTTTGSTVVVWIMNFGTSFVATPVTDSKGNTWTQQGSPITAIGGYELRCYTAVNITGGSGHTFTTTVTATGAQSIYVCEATGAPASPTITQNSNTSATSPYTSPSISPSTPTVLIGLFMSNAASGAGGTETDTWGGSFAPTDKIEAITDSSNFVTGSMAANAQAASGTFNTSVTVAGVTVTNSANWIVAIQEPIAGPTINAHPFNVYLAPEQVGVFQVAATTSGGSLSYQWQDNRTGSFANVTDGVGGTTAIYTTGPISFAAQGRLYQVLVTDSNGTVTSNPATLTVLENDSGIALRRPRNRQGGLVMWLDSREWF